MRRNHFLNRFRDEQELRNGLVVMEWIYHLVDHPDVTVDLNLICHFNKLILHGTERDYWAGRLRATVDWQEPEEWNRPRALIGDDQHPGLAVVDPTTGELIVEFPPTAQVKPLLDELLGWLYSPAAQALHPAVRAAIFHRRFTAIHPFRDGNGRTARALVTLLLWREGYAFSLFILQRILDERREAYIAALCAADRGDEAGWIAFFVRAVRDALAEALRLDDSLASPD